MSSQNSQKLRRNASPSTKQGPLRATQQFGLVNSSPSRSSGRRSPTSPTPNKDIGKGKVRSASETGVVVDRRSPSSPAAFKVEKPKVVLAGKSSSLENITGPYLSGQWPKDWTKQDGVAVCPQSPSFTTSGVANKETQTPEEWDDASERRRKSQYSQYKRSQSVGSGDNLSLKKDIKHKLQRKTILEGGRQVAFQRHSPIQGNHNATIVHHQSVPIKIPGSSSTAANGSLHIPRNTPGKARGSVEGLNQEVEKLIISGTKKIHDGEEEKVHHGNVDGHKAPTLELLKRNIDTQTPSQGDGFSGYELTLPEPEGHTSRASSDSDSRSQSVSPSMEILGNMDLEESVTGRGRRSETPESPMYHKPNNEFAREPPDGAEKIKIIDEVKDRTSITQLRAFTKPVSTGIIQPHERSAFHPTTRPLVEDAH